MFAGKKQQEENRIRIKLHFDRLKEIESKLDRLAQILGYEWYDEEITDADWKKIPKKKKQDD